jgi:hypothetical protein
MNPMNSMNEDTVRTLLADVVDTSEPPSLISIDAARKAGRRRQLANRVIAPVAVGAIAAVVAAGVMVVPHFRTANTGAGSTFSAAGTVQAAQTARDTPAPTAPAPTEFNALTVPVSFGWMPEGVTEDQAAINLTQTSLTMILTDGMTLNVSVRGWYPSDQYNMSVRGAFPGVKTDKKAPAVNGHPTYWSVALRGGKWTRDGIEWEYAPGAWAHLYGGMWIGYPNIQAQDLKMAASIRFDAQQPVSVPFKFTRGLPSGWQVTETQSVVRNGHVAAFEVGASPAGFTLPATAISGSALSITDDPTQQACQFTSPPPTSWITADGTRWGFWVTSGPKGDQGNCATTRVDGVGYVNMYYYWAGHNQALSLANLVQSMKFLGSNPADWTTNPLAG